MTPKKYVIGILLVLSFLILRFALPRSVPYLGSSSTVASTFALALIEQQASVYHIVDESKHSDIAQWFETHSAYDCRGDIETQMGPNRLTSSLHKYNLRTSCDASCGRYAFSGEQITVERVQGKWQITDWMKIGGSC